MYYQIARNWTPALPGEQWTWIRNSLWMDLRGHITEILSWNYHLLLYIIVSPTDTLKHFHFVYLVNPDSEVHGAIMGPTWVLSAPDGPHEPCYQGIHMEWCCHLSRLCGIVFACLLYWKYMWFINHLSLLLYIVFGSVCTLQSSHIFRHGNYTDVTASQITGNSTRPFVQPIV